MTTCPRCGTQVPGGLAHCPSCGTDTPTHPGARAPDARISDAATKPLAAKQSRESVRERLQTALGANYEVRGCVGRGGFAEVYEIWDRSLERKLAAKVLLPELAAAPGTNKRFTHEARTVARLNDPAILPIHFVGDAEGLAFYVMPFVEGDSVRALLRRQGKLSTAKTTAIAKPVLEALSHAHQAGLIHRDIKPDNVMLDAKTNRALLMDFGIAKALDQDHAANLTQAGHTVGTPYYMSPEQALGDKLDGRSDLYSLGATLFEMVTGKKPYDGQTAQEIVAKHVADPIPVPGEVDPTVPEWLSDVIVRLLQKRPDQRFQTADEALETLNAQAVADYSALDALTSEESVPGGLVIQGSGWALDEDLEPSQEIRPAEDTLYPGGADAATVEEDSASGAESGSLGITSLSEQLVRNAPPKPGAADAPAVETTPESTSASTAKPPDAGRPPAGPPLRAAAPPEPESPPHQPAAPVADPPTPGVREPDHDAAEIREDGEGSRRKTAMLAAAVVVIGAAAWLTFGRGGSEDHAPAGPRYTFVVNSLVEPVEISVNGEVRGILQPQQRDTLPHTGGQAPQVSWRLIRPQARNGRELGEAFSGVASATVAADGNQTAAIVGRTRRRAMFAPVITNPTGQTWAVLVNADTPEETRCDCVIPPRATGVHIGYYPLRSNPVLRFYPAGSNYRGRYRERTEMAGSVDALSGALEIQIPRR